MFKPNIQALLKELSQSNTSWVNDQSGITGSESVAITVGNNTRLEGGLIANTTRDANGNLIDQGNLSLTTKTLTVANLNNNHDSISMGGGINASASSASLSAQYGGEERKGLTQATIGQGTITVTEGTTPDNLNRDVTQASIVTEEHKVGGLNANLTVDTRMFSEEGRKEIKDDVMTASAITNAIEQIATTEKAGVFDFFDETQKNVDVYEGMKAELAKNPELAAQLQDPNLSPEKKQEMLQTVANTVAQSLGYATNEVNVMSTDEHGANDGPVKGHYGENQQTYVNDKYNDSTSSLIATLGHETQHSMDDQAGTLILNNEDQNDYADNFGADVAFYTSGALDYTHGGSLASTNTHNSGQVTTEPSIFNDNTFANNNKEFGGLDKSGGDDLVIFGGFQGSAGAGVSGAASAGWLLNYKVEDGKLIRESGIYYSYEGGAGTPTAAAGFEVGIMLTDDVENVFKGSYITHGGSVVPTGAGVSVGIDIAATSINPATNQSATAITVTGSLGAGPLVEGHARVGDTEAVVQESEVLLDFNPMLDFFKPSK